MHDQGIIGDNIPNVDALKKVVGDAAFAADLGMQGLLHLKVLRSDRHHARILRLGIRKAAEMPGVVSILTHRDIPGKNRIGIINKDQPILAEDRVRFFGDPIALVVAESEMQASQAMSRLEVTYEDLPASFSPEESLESPILIHESGNLLHQREIIKGDVEKGFTDADLIIEKVYRTSMLDHFYLEPDAGLGWIDEDGRITICSSTQNPHYDHAEIVSVLGIDPGDVRSIQATTGGGFGGKLDISVQCFLALAVHHTKRPVSMVYTRQEALLTTAKRHPMLIRYKTGAYEDGRLAAARIDITADTGAYGSYGMAVADRAAVHAAGPYRIPHLQVSSRVVYTNNPFCGAMRGFGVPQVAFAHESQMDILAEELGKDPIELRLVNAMARGSETPTGQILEESVGIVECLQRIRQQKEDAVSLLPGAESLPGTGVGAMWYGIGNTGVKNPASARVELDQQGRFVLYTGAADIGQGSNTVLSQIAASEMGINIEQVRLVRADTALTLNAGATSASRQTYISGNAVMKATAKLRKLVLEHASRYLRVNVNEIGIVDGMIQSEADGRVLTSLDEVVERSRREGKPLEAEAAFDPETSLLDPQTGQGNPYATYAFACHMADIDVDPVSGVVNVHRIVAAHDVGKAVNPMLVEGQITGGVAMGLGFALMEEFVPGTTRFAGDYLVPTVKDVPSIVPIIVEDPEPTGPYGAKGVGEPALIPTAPAILNAIAQATGVRIYHLPATSERVFMACRQLRSGTERIQEE